MSRTKLRASRLAPTIRMTAKAASTTSRPSRRRRACAPRKPVPDDRSALRKASERSTRAPRAAGASPAATAASTRRQQPRTSRPSHRAPRRPGAAALAGAMAGSRRTSHHASMRPSALPAIENDRALGEQLPHDPRAAAADGRPDGQLALSRHAAREQQVRDVGARNQTARAQRRRPGPTAPAARVRSCRRPARARARRRGRPCRRRAR